MNKYFNPVSNLTGVFGGILAFLFGGFDSLMISLLVLICLDYITGIFKAAYLQELSSKIGFKGIIKKIVLLIIVCLAVICEKNVGIPAIREITIMFFLTNEGLSILENAVAMDIPIPAKIKEALLSIRDKK